MDELKKIVAGAVITVIIGGSAYTVSQTDVISNFAQDTGMSQQQATDYVENLTEEDMDSWTNIGNDLIDDSKIILQYSDEIDCELYQYEWETSTLTCTQGKAQLYNYGNDELALGKSYVKLDDSSANDNDISTAISNIDKLNKSTDYAIISFMLDKNDIQESKNTNSYNKSVLRAVLEEE